MFADLPTNIGQWYTRHIFNCHDCRSNEAKSVGSGKTLPLEILPTSIKKAFKEELAVIITDVACNSSFRTATFPQSMNKGQVTPLLKKPGLDTTDFKNFRPITKLTTISKIIERLALQRLRPYLASTPNYCRLQSAYFTGRSTESALVKVVGDILGHIDGGSVVALVSHLGGL